ncbi:muscle M-line assembly protein unc-89 [Anopheles ziemanni]|uniref:muscle M-line assembly protein unc-89 n=1 Tax=Anopheles coustani TaxID=139045 RepID=UPI00265A8C1E|nr:muscle M-line assembly protein unc-89 [Anopheles coustani]XP_058177925.1 muscle M-line assembly protein unc-89 [Anopheles ziemanni]
MSEPKALDGRKGPDEAKGKQYTAGAAFSNIADDGLLTGPAVKTATQTDDAVLLSDEENKTLITLEPPKKTRDEKIAGLPAGKPAARDDARNLVPGAVGKTSTNLIQPKKVPGKPIVTTRDLLKTLKEQTISSKPPPAELPSKESLLQKMRNRLSKQIEIKSTSTATPVTPRKPLDTSGAIEIPQDLILSSEIPPTPIPSIETKETKLEEHDLIAILEGNDVEIRENATEIEVCVGTNSSGEGVEEMEIFILDQDDMEKAKKEREKEIARRQMESLPTFPKNKRRTKASNVKTTTKTPTDDELPASDPLEVTKLPVQSVPAIPKVPTAVTIKGQTTIRPIGGKSLTNAMLVKEEPRENSPTAKGAIKIAKDSTRPTTIAEPKEKTSPAPKLKSPPTTSSPQTPNKSSELVDALVSDWDDEPQADAGATEKRNIGEISKPSTGSIAKADGGVLEEGNFATPSLPHVTEQRRVIKKKIIWDPSDATIPFAALVKSNRGNVPVPVSAQGNPPLATMRRKRADSVAVRMFNDGPPKSVQKRALTPEPVRPSPARENNNTTTAPNTTTMLDAKAKKRKKNEIERLLADEGAINMLYDVECEANQKDLLKTTAVDTSDEDEKLLAKTKIITDAVINQGKSPTDGTNQQGLRVRPKRAPTPSNQQTPITSVSGGASDTGLPQKPDASAVGSQVSTKKINQSPVGAAAHPATGGRKRKNASTLKDWDYVYNAQGGDDAMIIRRRSNSSYSSSCASPRRLSIDQSAYESPNAMVASGTTKPSDDDDHQAKEDDSFLFAKPTPKPVTNPGTGNEMKVDPSLLANMRGKLSKALKNIRDPLEMSDKKHSSPPNNTTGGNNAAKQTQAKRRAGAKGTPAMSLDEVDFGGEYVVSATGELIKQENDDLHEATKRRLNDMKQVSWQRYGAYVEILLKTKGIVTSGGGDNMTALKDVFSMQAMNELSEVFTLLEKESRVAAVLLMSSGEHFSRGLDVGHLLQPVHKRKVNAEEMGECLKSFLKSLISFSKPIVAAVHGDVLGMGVTILPIFDIVLAQTGSTFMTPYGHFGYLPEALKAFTSCRTLKPKALTDLILQGKRISSVVALDYGLVTDVAPSDRFHERARALTVKMSSQSTQAIQSIKQHLRREFLAKLDFVLTLEQKKQTQQWTTPECQQKFKLFINKGGELGRIA